MNLYGESWEFSECGGWMVLTFAIRPPRDWRHSVKAHGFRPRTELQWIRKADGNGRAAAQWLEKRLRELERGKNEPTRKPAERSAGPGV